MPEISPDEMKNLLNKYRGELSIQLGGDSDDQPVVPMTTREYNEFKKEYLPKQMSLYEKACNISEKILKIAPDKKKVPGIEESIGICHLNVTPTGVYSLSFLLPIIIIILGSFLGFAFVMLLTGEPSFFFVFFFLFVGLVMIKPLQDWPLFMANNWRMKSSNQMVLCIFYVVTFMRHTSNLELAIDFAAEHLGPPLSLDMKKILWDVETEKFESIKESLDTYLDSWRKWNMEFIEAFHLIEGSLLESEDRRLTLLDKSLDVMLEGTYEKMLHYAHNLKGPMTMLHMLGIILPILGLVILPLVVSFMEGVQWFHISTLYNIALPIGVFYLGKTILAKRPTGYGESDITENNPEIAKYKNVIINLGGIEFKVQPMMISLFVGIVLFIIGMSPIIMHVVDPQFDIEIGEFELLGYRVAKGTEDTIIGPFGLGASILSLGVVLAFGVGAGLYYKLRSKNIIEIRNNAKKLEDEFASALFQLGNRLSDGIPVEMAFGKVAEAMPDTMSGNFFGLVSQNIQRLGMSAEQAIFDKRHGAIVYFPSALIESSMKVLTQSVKKGPNVAAQALINISRYIKEIHKVNERLKDLLADVISSMKSQISALTPAIAGIVIGITSMVTTIISKLSGQLENLAAGAGDTAAAGGMGGGILDMFSEGIPTFYFQIIVGLYVVQIGYILTLLTNGIENGSDKLNEQYLLGKNLIRSTVLYSLIAGAVVLLFNMVAGQIVAGVGT